MYGTSASAGRRQPFDPTPHELCIKSDPAGVVQHMKFCQSRIVVPLRVLSDRWLHFDLSRTQTLQMVGLTDFWARVDELASIPNM
jgi:hypothetical protein